MMTLSLFGNIPHFDLYDKRTPALIHIIYTVTFVSAVI